MTVKEIYDGVLLTENGNIQVKIKYISRVTVSVDFPDDKKVQHGDEFNGFILSIGVDFHEFGRCRYIVSEEEGKSGGRLVFLNDIYDFNCLFFEKKIVTLDSFHNNLALVFSQRDNLNETFVKYVADLTFDLKVYRHFFNDIDAKYFNEDENTRSILFKVVLEKEGRKFLDFLDDKLKELERVIADFTREDHRLHGFYLRKQLWDVIECSEFMLHCNLRPRGYAGDSELMRMIYENDYRGDSTFSKILYKYSLDHPGAVAVRNRKIMIPEYLKSVVDNGKFKGGICKFMSVACGPAYELSDIFINSDDTEKYHCTLLDQDPEALKEAEDNIIRIQKKLGSPIQVRYLEDSVRTMLRTPDLSDQWGRFHFIYSMGLFDYLAPTVAKAVIEKIYDLLEPGGQLLIGNYHLLNKSKWFMEYWHDWVLYYRSEEEFKEILKDTNAVDIDIRLDDSGSQMFLSAKKPE